MTAWPAFTCACFARKLLKSLALTFDPTYIFESASTPPSEPPLPPKLADTSPDCCDPSTTFPSIEAPLDAPAVVSPAESPENDLLELEDPRVDDVISPVLAADPEFCGVLESVGDGLVPEVVEAGGEFPLPSVVLEGISLGGDGLAVVPARGLGSTSKVPTTVELGMLFIVSMGGVATQLPLSIWH